jgi:threonyl-tRNA synthetase
MNMQSGFYYDAYMGENTISDETLKKIDAQAMAVCKKKYPFQVNARHIPRIGTSVYDLGGITNTDMD